MNFISLLHKFLNTESGFAVFMKNAKKRRLKHKHTHRERERVSYVPDGHGLFKELKPALRF